MNKKIVIIGIIYSFLVVFSLTNMYVNMEYNLNVFEYIKKSLPFTEEEKVVRKTQEFDLQL